jgi:hypothetical protein
MENRTFKVAKNLDGTQKLIHVMGQTRFYTVFMSAWEKIQLWLLPLRFGR